MDKELMMYERKLMDEIQKSKKLSWKRIWKSIELASLCSTRR